MDDHLDAIGAIYDAIGVVDRWQHLTARLAGHGLEPEVAHHLKMARHAHDAHVRLSDIVRALTAVHDRLALAALVIDRHGRVQWANAAARRMLDDAAAAVRLAGGRIEAADADQSASLARAIARASSAGSDVATRPDESAASPFVAITRPGRPPVPVVAVPVREPDAQVFEREVPLLVLVFDPDHAPAPDPGVLQALFGFTARESELAVLLLQGLSLEDAAHALGIAVSTARTFLAQLTAKTDSHTQAGLVRRLLDIPRVLPHAGE